MIALMRLATGALLAVFAVATPALVVAGHPLATSGVLYAIVGCGYLLVGLLITERKPGNRVGPLAFSLGLVIGVVIAGHMYVALPGPPPGYELAAWLAIVLDPLVFTLGALIFMFFPDGTLPSRRWAVVVALTVVPAVLFTLAAGFTPGPFVIYPDIDNPLGIGWLARGGDLELLPLLQEETLASSLFAMPVAFALLAPVARWRRADAVERAQIRWIGASAALNVLALAFYLFGGYSYAGTVHAGDIAVGLAQTTFPVAIGIAVLRYRLYDIDRLISRTIGWAIVTGVLVSTFVLLVIGLQAVLAPLTGGGTLAVAASTLVVATFFAPVRSRVQAAVDRRFDRTRYDGERLLAAFGERLRDEVDLVTISRDVRATVDGSVRPAQTGLWLRQRPGS
jgi:hypothetical protein